MSKLSKPSYVYLSAQILSEGALYANALVQHVRRNKWAGASSDFYLERNTNSILIFSFSMLAIGIMSIPNWKSTRKCLEKSTDSEASEPLLPTTMDNSAPLATIPSKQTNCDFGSSVFAALVKTYSKAVASLIPSLLEISSENSAVFWSLILVLPCVGHCEYDLLKTKESKIELKESEEIETGTETESKTQVEAANKKDLLLRSLHIFAITIHSFASTALTFISVNGATLHFGLTQNTLLNEKSGYYPALNGLNITFAVLTCLSYFAYYNERILGNKGCTHCCNAFFSKLNYVTATYKVLASGFALAAFFDSFIPKEVTAVRIANCTVFVLVGLLAYPAQFARFAVPKSSKTSNTAATDTALSATLNVA